MGRISTDCDNPTDDNEHWGEPMGGYCECGHGTVEHPTNGECECPMNADGVELFFNHDKMRCEQSMEPECPGWWHEESNTCLIDPNENC